KANPMFAHLEPIREPTDEQDILRPRLGENGFKRKIMEDDGNCLLHSFSDQFWEMQVRRLVVREVACSLKANPMFAHLEPIREPTDEQDILRPR
nr:hypothetical protein [Tanacetum cinerariifolium]